MSEVVPSLPLRGLTASVDRREGNENAPAQLFVSSGTTVRVVRAMASCLFILPTSQELYLLLRSPQDVLMACCDAMMRAGIA